MNILENLNENQSKAVLATDGPLLILAGAGSGKTRVITHRIAYLIREKGVPPFAIMAVTFTNKAAGEMRSRIIDLIGPLGEQVFMKTFHSASVFILRRYGNIIGVPSGFTIYDQRDQEMLIKDILIEKNLDPKKIRPAMIASKISEVKDRAEILEGGDVNSLLPDYYSFSLADIYEQYQLRLTASNALDFNDLLIKTVELLRKSPETLAALQKKWRYFMIDEYQDTNYSQYLICKYLASASRNLCVVGDDDQSIYSWRGADVRNILNFEKDYSDARVITLGDNYRSTIQILAVASSIIQKNRFRKEKMLNAFRGEGEPAVWCQANNEYGEAEYVVNTLISLKHREALKNDDFAIFYRTNAQSRIFEEHLRRENIPYRVVGGLRFYDRKEIRDILAYLRFITNPSDTISLSRIINTPARGIGAVTIEKIKDQAYQEDTSEWEIIRRGQKGNKKTSAGIRTFADIITRSMEMAPRVPTDMKLAEFVQEVIELSGYTASLKNDNSLESRSRLENLDEFINSIFEYQEFNPDATVDQFIQEISLLTTTEQPEPEDLPLETVTLMTVHNAKGLEFPVVFLTGLEEGLFPHVNSSDSEEGIEEERRLCYVGITRAKDRVYLTNAHQRRVYGNTQDKLPSCFLNEIPPELLKTTTHGPQENSISYNASPAWGRSSSQDKRATREPAPSPKPAVSDSQYSVNQRIMHPRYGTGKIVEIQGKGDNVKLTIRFSSGGSKSFLEKHTPLERI